MHSTLPTDHSFAVLAAAVDLRIHNRQVVGKSVGGQGAVVQVAEGAEHIQEEYILVLAGLKAAVVDHIAGTAVDLEEGMSVGVRSCSERSGFVLLAER